MEKTNQELLVRELTVSELQIVNGGSEWSNAVWYVIGWCCGAYATGVKLQSDQIMENDGYTVCM